MTVVRMLAATAAVTISSVCASAQQTSDVVTAIVVDTKPLIEQLVPYIIAAAGAVITTLGTIAVAYLNKLGKKWGVELDEKNRDTLLAAVKNTAAGAIAAGAVKIEQNGKVSITPGVLADIAKDVIENRAPDAVAHFGLSPDAVAQKIVEQVPQILTGSTPSAAPAPSAV